MRIVMFGTGPFAVPTFEALLASDHDVCALFTRPIADAGNRRKSAANPTRDVAETNGLVIHDPMDANAPESLSLLKNLNADLFVVCDYGQILSRECLGSASKGDINLHGSLLPKYRGAAPINWCLYNGDPETGITIIHMTAKLDGGPCLAKRTLPISDEDTAESIEPKLANLGVDAVIESINLLQDWDGDASIGTPQDQSLATKAPRLKKSDGLLKWQRPALQLFNQIRAFQPWPGSYTNWHSPNKKQPLRLIVHHSRVVPPDALEPETANVNPGQVFFCNKEKLLVQTGDGVLSIEAVQPAGKKNMPVADFLRGNQPTVGDQFE